MNRRRHSLRITSSLIFAFAFAPVARAADLNTSGTNQTFTSGTATYDNINIDGSLTQTGGTLNATIMNVGYTTGAGTFTLNSGALNLSSDLYIGLNGMTGTTAINGGTLTTSGIVRMAVSGTSLALNGGTLATQQIIRTTPNAVTLTFNGGVLKALGSNFSFIDGSVSMQVAAGGAFIDTQGFTLQWLGNMNGTAGDGGLTKLGTGTLILPSVNTYTGTTTVNGGTIELAGPAGTGTGIIRGNLIINAGTTLKTSANNALGYTAGLKVNTVSINGGTLLHVGSGDQGWGIAYTLNGGTMTAQSGADPVNSPCKFAFGNNTSVTVNGTTPSAISGRIDLRGDGGVTNVNFTVNTGASLNVQGPITSSMPAGGDPLVGFTKLGAGTMTLSNINTFEGDVHVNGGKLALAASGSIQGDEGIIPNVTVAAGASIVVDGSLGGNITSAGAVAGSGSIGGTLTVSSGGSLAPGNNAGIFFVGGLTMQSGSALNLEIGRTTPGYVYDLIHSDGGITLGGNVSVTNLGNFFFGEGQTFYILQSDGPISGTFANVVPLTATTGSLFSGGATYLVNYADHYPIPGNPNAVSFTLVPELSSPLLLLGAVAMLGGRRRGRRD